MAISTNRKLVCKQCQSETIRNDVEAEEDYYMTKNRLTGISKARNKDNDIVISENLLKELTLFPDDDIILEQDEDMEEENSSKSNRILNLNPTQSGSLSSNQIQYGLFSRNPSQLGAADHSPSQLGLASHSPSQFRIANHRPSQLGLASHNPLQLRIASHIPSQLGPASHSPSQLEPASYIPSQLGSASDRPIQLGITSHSLSQLGSASYNPSQLASLSITDMLSSYTPRHYVTSKAGVTHYGIKTPQLVLPCDNTFVGKPPIVRDRVVWKDSLSSLSDKSTSLINRSSVSSSSQQPHLRSLASFYVFEAPNPGGERPALTRYGIFCKT